MFYTFRSSHSAFSHFLIIPFSNTLCLLLSPYLNLCRHQQQSLSLFSYPTPANECTIPGVQLWLTVINAVSRLLQTRWCALRGTRGGEHPTGSECISQWPVSWQQKLLAKMAPHLGTKWIFLTRHPHATTHLSGGKGTRHSL